MKIKESIDDAVAHLGNEVAKKVIDDIKNVLISASEDDDPEDVLTSIEDIIAGGSDEDGQEDGDESEDQENDPESEDDDENEDDDEENDPESEDDDENEDDDEEEVDDAGDDVTDKKKKKKKKSENSQVNLSPSVSDNRFQESVELLVQRARRFLVTETDIEGDDKSLARPKNPGKAVQKKGGSLSNRSRINSNSVSKGSGSGGLSESARTIKNNILDARS